MMVQEYRWNDEARDDLRETLRWFILGELRLKKNDAAAILEMCRESFIDERAPEDESPAFVQFAEDEVKRVSAELVSEQAKWPAETDCDRLDRVEATLREHGILLWQVSPCCDSCTVGELPGRIEAVDGRYPGFRENLRGYAFFIDQNVPEELSEGTEISVCLAYGWLSPDGTDVERELYDANALGIAREICACLHSEGFEVDWDGDMSRKICFGLNWQRREMLD
jgi:hypothetical protein